MPENQMPAAYPLGRGITLDMSIPVKTVPELVVETTAPTGVPCRCVSSRKINAVMKWANDLDASDESSSKSDGPDYYSGYGDAQDKVKSILSEQSGVPMFKNSSAEPVKKHGDMTSEMLIGMLEVVGWKAKIYVGFTVMSKISKTDGGIWEIRIHDDEGNIDQAYEEAEPWLQASRIDRALELHREDDQGNCFGCSMMMAVNGPIPFIRIKIEQCLTRKYLSGQE